MNTSPTMFEVTTTDQSVSITSSNVDALDDSELDRAPFGIICVDREGTILRYNLYESRLARLDRNQVLGRGFFEEIARCTRTDAFEGRFRRFVEGTLPLEEQRFEYVFDFAFGAQQVVVELHRAPEGERYYFFINRRSVRGPRPEAREIAASQASLAPDEARAGVQRDGFERRFVEAPVTLFTALRATFAKFAPEAWTLFAYEWGLQWGRRAAIELEADSLEAANCALEDLTMVDASKRIADYTQQRGWGAVHFSFDGAKEGVLSIQVERSVLAESASQPWLRERGARSGACWLLSGFFAGTISHLASRRVAVREVSCQANGAPCCSFVLVAADRIGALERAIDEGASDVNAVREVLRRPSRQRP
jgi:photoactive yellow protein